MKTVMKLLVSAAVMAAAASAAHADTTLPDTDQSNLFFFVTNTNNNTTYTVQLSQLVNGATGYFNSSDDALGHANTVTTVNGKSNFSYNFTGDTALLNFVSTAGAAANWGIIGGASAGDGAGVNKGIGNTLSLGTVAAANAATALSSSESILIGGGIGGYNSDIGTLNGNLAGATETNQGVFATAQSTNGAGNLSWYTAGLNMTGVAVGASPATLYGEGSTTAGSGHTFAFNLGSATFDGTTLSFTGNGAAVPVPAAAWLFGSGLMGLLGIGRRRRDGSTLAA